ncbi:hypothetical protein Goshw_017730 [Gossypium schwendimanii]|uniref:RNase H type-1 domain-containing protein n=1 Tax=Gossypium schwendimanii TaxID=34291 RepID=A0A7J9M4Q1_GOSSC|nr:hypothetical protein [Gossypium schwendimanii]
MTALAHFVVIPRRYLTCAQELFSCEGSLDTRKIRIHSFSKVQPRVLLRLLKSCRGKEYISVHEDIRSSYQENSPEFDAELWGSLDGLVLLQQQGYNKIMIHSDSLQVIKGIYDSSLVDSNSALIRRIHQILLKVDHWRTKHVSREKNRVVDCLAKMLLNKKDDL